MAKKLLEYVQAHERDWGGETYPDRPSLEHILAAPVVAFWIDPARAGGKKHIITIHNDLQPIEDYLRSIIRRLPIGFPARRLAILFVNGKEMRIGSKFAFREVE